VVAVMATSLSFYILIVLVGRGGKVSGVEELLNKWE